MLERRAPRTMRTARGGPMIGAPIYKAVGGMLRATRNRHFRQEKIGTLEEPECTRVLSGIFRSESECVGLARGSDPRFFGIRQRAGTLRGVRGPEFWSLTT